MKHSTLNIKGELLSLEKPLVMGILNVTPDSFYEGSRKQTEDSIRKRIEAIISEGGDMIDVGGYSSRPDADDISAEEEMKRLETALKIISKDYPEAIVSVDTFRAEVARRCVEEFGVAIINDISGGDLDKDMFRTVAELHVPYILMHMRGTPKTMQQNTDYNNITADIMTDLSAKVERLRLMGMHDIILDPGFGFSKTMEQNYELMRHLKDFELFGLPLLVGISRKSMIYKLLGCTAEESLNGTSVLHTFALLNGANILRVHDVKEAVETVRICGMLSGEPEHSSTCKIVNSSTKKTI